MNRSAITVKQHKVPQANGKDKLKFRTRANNFFKSSQCIHESRGWKRMENEEMKVKRKLNCVIVAPSPAKKRLN